MTGKNIRNRKDTDLLKEAPILSQIGNNNPFTVPTDYFERLKDEITFKISNQQIPVKAAIFKPVYYYAAAVITLLISVSVVYFSYQKNDNQEIAKNNPYSYHSNKPEISANHNSKTENISMTDTSNSKPIEGIIPKSGKIEEANESINAKYAVNNQKIKNADSRYDSKPVSNLKSGNYQTDQNNQKQVYAYNSITPENIQQNQVGTTNGKVANLNSTTNSTISPDKNITRIRVNLGKDTCSEVPFTLNAGDFGKDFQYQWSTGEKSKSIQISESGTYSVSVSSISNPEIMSSDNIEINILPKPEFGLKENFTLCSNESIVLYAINNDNFASEYQYEWYPNHEKTSFLTIKDYKPGTYNIGLLVKGCKLYQENTVVIVNDCNLDIPNVFTPNGDGKNDFFLIKGLENYSGSELIVSDRNGRKVYENTNYQNDWDGGNNPDGVYYYILKLSDKQHTIRQGTITIYGKFSK